MQSVEKFIQEAEPVLLRVLPGEIRSKLAGAPSNSLFIFTSEDKNENITHWYIPDTIKSKIPADKWDQVVDEIEEIFQRTVVRG